MGLEPLLVRLLAHGGSHDVPTATAAAVRAELNAAVRAVWLVHSPDGVTRPPPSSPLASAASPRNVARHHIDPVFVASHEVGSLQPVQRGATVGLKPHSYRQLCAEMLGARLPGVVVNVAVNEGGMNLRVSCNPLIKKADGADRTKKAISPIQAEGDCAAYGTRDEKIDGAVRQTHAWDTNALLCKPLFLAINPPRSVADATRGDHSAAAERRAQWEQSAHDAPFKARSRSVMCAAAADVGDVATRTEAALAPPR
jgi:hypothetical protein